MEKSLLDKILDFIFSKTYVKHLLWIFIIAFILRVIVAINLGPNADEMLHATHAIDIIKSRLLQIMDQDPVWFYITDIFFRLFNVSMLSGRIFSVITGSLSAIVIYLITVEIFNNRKLAFISSILTAFSSFFILTSIAEMDVPMTFFVLLSFYLLIKAMKKDKNKDFYLSYLFLGIAIMVKQIAITFVPAYIIAVILYYYNKEKKFSKIAIKSLFKNILIFGIILLIIVSPILVYNYLLYKDQKLVDVQFSRFLGIGTEVYAPIAATMKNFNPKDLFFSYEDGKHLPGLVESTRFYVNFDLILLILFIFGIFFLFKKDKFWSIILFLLFLFPYLFLSGTSLLPYHFSYAIPIFSIFAASAILFLSENLESKLKIKHILTILIILIIVFEFYTLTKNNTLSGKSEVAKMMDFSKNIENDALVIVDPRIYRGRITWMFNDKHYLEVTQLNQANEIIRRSPSNPTTIKTYLIECAADDCGWGTISQQPEFNKSIENFFASFTKGSEKITTITNVDREPYFTVYRTTLSTSPLILDIADSTHIWFYYPVRYKLQDQIFGKYKIHNSFDRLLDFLAHLILYIEVIIGLIALLIPFYLLYRAYKNENTQHNNPSL